MHGPIGPIGPTGPVGYMRAKTPHYVLSQLQRTDIGGHTILSRYHIINFITKSKHQVVLSITIGHC